mgnify:CR=1 FL=1
MPIKSVVLIAEAETDGNPSAAMDLAAVGDRLGQDQPVGVHWLVVGKHAAAAGEYLSESTGYPATALVVPPEKPLTGALLANLAKPVLADLRPEIIAFLHTSSAQDCVGPLAIALEAACITGVQGIIADGDQFIFQRAVFGGKWLTEIRAGDRPVVLTVLPGFFQWEDTKRQPGPLEIQQPSPSPQRIRLIEARASDCEAALGQAETVVAAGRGIGSQENLDLIHRLAACFPKSAVAGSRLVCDAGWLPYSRQVGVTGATVSPALYLACGISGAFQHLVGMSGSRFVAAINKDPDAAIFRAADVGVVEDLNTFLPLLIEALERNRSYTA